MSQIDPLITITAVLVGAVGSYVFGKLTDRDRFSRDLRVRWDQRRLDVYVEFLSAAKTAGALANRIHREQRSGIPAEEIEQLRFAMEASELRRTERFEALMLLADKHTGEAAHGLNDALYPLIEAARSQGVLAEDDWHRRADQWVQALNRFHIAARADLKVASAIARRDTAALAVYQPERAHTHQVPMPRKDPAA